MNISDLLTEGQQARQQVNTRVSTAQRIERSIERMSQELDGKSPNWGKVRCLAATALVCIERIARQGCKKQEAINLAFRACRAFKVLPRQTMKTYVERFEAGLMMLLRDAGDLPPALEAQIKRVLEKIAGQGDDSGVRKTCAIGTRQPKKPQPRRQGGKGQSPRRDRPKQPDQPVAANGDGYVPSSTMAEALAEASGGTVVHLPVGELAEQGEQRDQGEQGEAAAA
jgi:hypothetical protein